jgi:hypothetical protein
MSAVEVTNTETPNCIGVKILVRSKTSQNPNNANDIWVTVNLDSFINCKSVPQERVGVKL